MSCSYPALYRYTWPGQDEKRICLAHSLQVLGFARALGFYLQMIPLTVQEVMDDHQCHQEVDPEVPNDHN